jgi:hypothetical protein
MGNIINFNTVSYYYYYYHYILFKANGQFSKVFIVKFSFFF